ncbi:hypothetical protein PO878_21390 [Iamia majanohamensis]|uniref:Uncharacterized protein n=1 Tax=Iamia majanohamensis TaxID=467976 RepID=A0AAE9Y9G2_9ACTN|nr:hypothetical protein [Iamia majanohamensis]WCO67048.1 hypothetical protein PO878_21390 [Iamia majanohamensis]
MAVLTLPGADAVLAAQAAALPQPDQVCGPVSARSALHAVLEGDEVPGLTALARASGTAIWPHDDPAGRPPGALLDRTGWEALPAAPDAGSSGTDAAGLTRGVATATDGRVVVVPASGVGADGPAVTHLLVALARAAAPVGVVANVRTGVLDPGAGWDVGHFVALWAVDPEAPDGPQVAVADTYPELGAPGAPPGCRWVPAARLAAAVADPPGRGLLLLARPADEGLVTALVEEAGLAVAPWST